jgi:hypothetical protein
MLARLSRFERVGMKYFGPGWPSIIIIAEADESELENTSVPVVVEVFGDLFLSPAPLIGPVCSEKHFALVGFFNHVYRFAGF